MSLDENPLGTFLRARRELLDPDDVDLPQYGRRRVKGLRREELAMLAGISTHYYSRLERGTNRNPSPQVIDAIAAAMQLDEQAHSHLRRLAEPQPAPRRRSRRRSEKVVPGLELLLKNWTNQPAVVVGRYRDVLVANELAMLLNPGFAPGVNLLRHTFLDPTSREIYLDWQEAARGAVAGLRASAGVEAGDPRLTELVGELSVGSEEFRQMWARHDARQRTEGSKRYYTPTVGPITLDYVTFTVNGTDGQTLFVFFAEPGSTHERSLALLAATARDDQHPPSAQAT